MAPPPRLRILSVGSNAISAFLSWRLQATTSCDVTLVWKSGYEAVSQYGVSFKSKAFGNERFKPRHVVRTPEDAASRENAFDYVILCVKALPDVYDLAAVIESVVTPQHTCILVNTTNTLGVESHLEQRFPTNVVLSLVSGVEISQIGASEFEHLNSSEIWVGATHKQTSIPSSIQNDMAAALAMTLASGQVDCKVSENIRQEQFDRMIGPIAFYPTSVMFETSNHAQLLEKVGVRQLVLDIIEELLQLARANACSFPSDFAQKTIETMTANGAPNTMYQDFQSRRPMEIETYLGSPVKLATESGVRVPRIETLYAVLHHVNAMNLSKPRTNESPPPVLAQPPPRMSSAPPPRGMNGPMRGGRTPSGMMPRRGPPPPGMSRPPSAQPQAARMPPRDPSLEGLEEFSHLVMYDDAASAAAVAAENGLPQNGTNGYPDMPPGPPSSAADLALRERELAIRQRELQIREQEMGMRRGGPRRPPPPRSTFDEEDEDDYFDPMDALPIPSIDPDQVDMLSLTSRRAKKSAPSASQFRKNPEITVNNGGGGGSRPGSSFSRYFGGRKRTSDRIMQEIPGLHDSLMDNPMMAYSSNRYGAVDRNHIQAGSRANSLTASRMGDYPPHPYPTSRRNSQSPATPPYGPLGPRMGRPSTSQDQSLGPPSGPRGGQPSPPGHMRAPVPRHPPGQGNAVGPQQVEQHYGVSNSSLAKGTPKHRSLTGSASASAESGDSGASANIDSETSAHSSQISLNTQQAATPVR
ncbi:ketopantoate reductase PanE/ApbA-domain-containing protein [Aspergillus alliaceus]|uniref:ketopantoate reductase PanE/ApbA-domain-containing protein n=1 Tax=Petromyces alliaceus TaxID=209559 RepID=UPI0012A58593|nr:ketopantoate reductase PanE/ApbA-domain-containing protein [Aspergillus alliaceus]KAB8231900.1 ketopantoate reductase PanE/ApbA-domain-containing protein [Aspergillus alliaceus]